MHFMIFITCLLILLLESCSQKNDDESRPYEFSFTIDGEQHRREKKDERGIIQGEFGFITADGIYHVTAYATDENGSFKILSMKNIRLSGPLDQNSKPLKYQPPKTQGKSEALKLPPSTTVKAFTGFTTQPTVRPGCGGCGIVTTTKLPPTDIVQNKFQSIFNDNYGIGSASTLAPTLLLPNQNPQSLHNGDNTENEFKNSQSNINGEDTKNQFKNPLHIAADVNDYKAQVEVLNQPKQPNVQHSTNLNGSNVGFGKLSQSKETLANLAQVKNDVIKVPGNPDIPIKDKYPGMQPGLPDGVNEKDLTDILYKFKYTVGFHGHYEKGLKNGAKVGGYFVNGRDGISRIVTYVADENGYRPKFKLVNLGLNSAETPKADSEKTFGLKEFEFVWYPLK